MTDHKNKSSSTKNMSVQGAQNVLSRLFRMICDEIQITEISWNNLMNRYLDDPRNGVPSNGKDRSSARGNLNKELHRAKMTWKVFLKGLRFLGPKWVRLEIHMGWHHHPTTIHFQVLDIGMDIENEEDDVVHSEVQRFHDRLADSAPPDAEDNDFEYQREHYPHSDAEISSLEEQHAKLWSDQIDLLKEFNLTPTDTGIAHAPVSDTTK